MGDEAMQMRKDLAQRESEELAEAEKAEKAGKGEKSGKAEQPRLPNKAAEKGC